MSHVSGAQNKFYKDFFARFSMQCTGDESKSQVMPFVEELLCFQLIYHCSGQPGHCPLDVAIFLFSV